MQSIAVHDGDDWSNFTDFSQLGFHIVELDVDEALALGDGLAHCVQTTS